MTDSPKTADIKVSSPRTLGPETVSKSESLELPIAETRQSMPDKVPSKPLDRWLAIVTLVVGVILVLVPRTQTMVVILLLICFCSLLHPVWNLWWIEDGRWRRVGSIALLAVGFFLIGVAAWPHEETEIPPSARFGSSPPIPAAQPSSSATPLPSGISPESPTPSTTRDASPPPLPNRPATSVTATRSRKTKSQTSSMLSQARQLYTQRRFDAAINLCDRLLSVDPGNIEAKALRSQISHTRNTLNNQND